MMHQQQPPEAGEDRKPMPQGLATWVMRNFQQAAADRRPYELKWIEAKKHRDGEYDQDSKEGGSQARVRSTRTKIKGVNARIMDVLFPGGNERNWKLKRSPKASLPDAAKQEAMRRLALKKLEQLQQDIEQIPEEQLQALAEAGQLPDLEALALAVQQGDVSQLNISEEEIEAAENEEAERRAREMSETIDDQLGDRFVAECKRVVNSGNTYGTGWLKGPLAMESVETQWQQDETGNWQLQEVMVKKPYFEFVPIWDIYPFPVDADSFENVVGIFQRHALPPHRLMELMSVPGVDREAIAAHIRLNPHGDQVIQQPFEVEVKKEDQVNTQSLNKRLYEMIEYTGYISGHDLNQYRDELPDDIEIDPGREYKVVVWSLATKVIRFEMFPYDDKTLNIYHRYVYSEAEYGIFGEGVAEDNKDSELIFNAALRGLLNNMGKAQDGITEINVSRLHPTELKRARNITSGDVVLTNGRNEESAYPTIRIHQIDTRISEFMSVIQLAKDIGEESTAQPRYSTMGANPKSGAAATARGLSMLMTQADTVNKDPIGNFDHGITKPFLKAMVHWNMQFNDDDDIKGDYQVLAIGSTALVAKEIHAQRVEAFANGTANPLDAPWIKRGELNRARAKALDFPEDEFVMTEQEYAEQQRKLAEMQARAGAPAAAQPGDGAPAG